MIGMSFEASAAVVSRLRLGVWVLGDQNLGRLLIGSQQVIYPHRTEVLCSVSAAVLSCYGGFRVVRGARPNGHCHYDFQPMTVASDEVKDYSFSWTIQDVADMYVMEVSLIPAPLTTHDAPRLYVRYLALVITRTQFTFSYCRVRQKPKRKQEALPFGFDLKKSLNNSNERVLTVQGKTSTLERGKGGSQFKLPREKKKKISTVFVVTIAASMLSIGALAGYWAGYNLTSDTIYELQDRILTVEQEIGDIARSVLFLFLRSKCVQTLMPALMSAYKC